MKEKIEELIKEGRTYTFSNNSYYHQSLGDTFSKASEDFIGYIAEVEDFIKSNYGEKSVPFELFLTVNKGKFTGNYKDDFERHHTKIIAALKSCLRIKPKNAKNESNKIEHLNNLFDKFHNVVKQLRSRYNNRPTIDVEDEYDIQDLLHGLLRLYFEDVRAEEWTPSYAGGSSRMDFLLKKEQIVIEVKKTRKGLVDKDLGKQLIEDKAKYSAHPDCKKLICFTYDPDGRIINPKGIENDLNSVEEDFEVSIIIKP